MPAGAVARGALREVQRRDPQQLGAERVRAHAEARVKVVAEPRDESGARTVAVLDGRDRQRLGEPAGAAAGIRIGGRHRQIGGWLGWSAGAAAVAAGAKAEAVDPRGVNLNGLEEAGCSPRPAQRPGDDRCGWREKD